MNIFFKLIRVKDDASYHMCVCWACFPQMLQESVQGWVVRCAAITNMQEMGFACEVNFRSFLTIRKMWSWEQVLVQQLRAGVALT